MKSSSLEITSDHKNLEAARAFIAESCVDFHHSMIDEDEMHMLILAVNEAITNIITHAYNEEKDKRILISLEVYDNHIAVTLTHWGKAFDPTNEPPPSFDGSRDHGFGLYIIDNCVDEVKYIFRQEKGNAIILKKVKDTST